MSKKEVSEPMRPNDYEGYPKLALSLVIVLALAVIGVVLKLFGLF